MADYAYMGSGDFLTPSNYRKMTNSLTKNCTDGFTICCIVLNETTEIPLTPFSADMIQNITNALGTGAQQGTFGTAGAVRLRR